MADEDFAEVEYAYKKGDQEPETGNVVVENLDAEQVEDAIRSRDKFLGSKGGRVNQVENYTGIINNFLDNDDIEGAARQLSQAEDEFSDTTVRRIKDNLDEEDLEKIQEAQEDD